MPWSRLGLNLNKSIKPVATIATTRYTQPSSVAPAVALLKFNQGV